MELTVATRGGELAIAQTKLIQNMLSKSQTDLRIKIKKVSSKGDKDRKTTLWELKGAGFFTSLIEEQLLAGKADFAVHSFKDLPTEENEDLTIGAVCDRRFAGDCIIAAEAEGSLDELPESAQVGTSSLRRAVQIKLLRRDLKPVPIRGNVPTRIRKVDEGKFDAVLLARAGIERIGLGGRISFCLDPSEFIPAAAQGALAVQCRGEDSRVRDIISRIDDEQSRITSNAERKVLSEMQCGCHTPVGVYAQIDGGDIKITAFICDLEVENFIKRVKTGKVVEAGTLARDIANELLEAGGRDILNKLEKSDETS